MPNFTSLPSSFFHSTLLLVILSKTTNVLQTEQYFLCQNRFWYTYTQEDIASGEQDKRGSLQVPSACMAECKIEVRGNKSVHSALSNDWSSRASIYLKCLPSHSPGSKQKLEPNLAFTLPSNMEIYAQTPNYPEGEELLIHFVEELAVQSPGARHQSHGREMWWMQTLFQPAPKQGRCASSTAWRGCWALGSVPSTWHR